MENYTLWRLTFFLSGFIFFSGLEISFYYRERYFERLKRWPGNLSLSIASSVMIKFFVPFSLMAVALWAEEKNIGLLNMVHDQPSFISIIFTLIILDFAIYWQHYFSHQWKYLWKLHRVHHTDIDLDASSALRFHPLEIVLSLFYKMLWIIVFGLPALGVLIFEIVLNFIAMFNHANLKIPINIEKYLRYVIVTPQMHIVHHSIERDERDCNFAFNLSIWDRIFKTYLKEFKSNGTIGLNHHRDAKNSRIHALLLQPFEQEQ